MMSSTTFLQGVAEVSDLMIHAMSLNRINQFDEWYRIRDRVVGIAVPLLEQTISIERGTLTLIDAMTELGVRNTAISALTVAEKALIAANSPERRELTKLIKDTMFGERAYGESIREVCSFYCCQACGRLLMHYATGCPSCGFLPDSPREISLATQLRHPYLNMNLVVACALRMKAGEKLEDFIENLDQFIRDRMESQGWNAFLQHQQEQIIEIAPDWSLTFAEASRCERCHVPVLASDAEACPKCGAEIDFPPMQRAIISADRLIGVIEDFICLDSTDEAKRMLSSLIRIRDNAFFFQIQPSPEDAFVFRQYWQGQVDLWNWNLDYTFRLRGGTFVDSYDKCEPSPDKDIKAKLLAKDLQNLLAWIGRKASLH